MEIIYARQSVDKKDSISIETQIEHCKRELTTGQKYVVYSDKGYSGSSLNRPEFQQMLSDVKSGSVKRIITYRLDRISRSVLDFANLIDIFDQYGVTFNSTQEKFDTSTPIGKAMLNITMVFAQLERETIQHRIKDNYYSRGEKGMYLGGPAPYGYTKVEKMSEQGKLKMLMEDSDTSHTLARIFHLYGHERNSLGEIVRTLNSEAVLSPNGKMWDTSKISRILRNPVYVKADVNVYNYYRQRGCKFTNEISEFTADRGCYLYGKRSGNERKYTDVTDHTVSLAPHEGLINSELFLQCQYILDKNLQIDNRRRQTKTTWLSGLIKCKSCGYAVIPKSSNGGRYTYLYCTGRQLMYTCKTDSNLGALKEVEAVIEKRIYQWANNYASLKANIEIAYGKERNRILCQIEVVNQDIEKLIGLAMDSNTITIKYLNDKISVLEAKKQELEKELEELSGSAHDSLKKEVSDLPREWDNLDISQKNAIATFLINRINLSHGEIEIEWKYDFTFN